MELARSAWFKSFKTFKPFKSFRIPRSVPRFHLMLEWVGDFEESIDDGGKSVRAFQPVISPGFRTARVNQEKLQVVVGAAAPIGLNRKADNYGALLYLSIEHDFQ